MLNRLTAGQLLPDHKLTLKISLLTMLVRDINAFKDYGNDDQYIAKIVCSSVFLLKSYTDHNHLKVLALPNMFYGLADTNVPVQALTRTQLLLRS